MGGSSFSHILGEAVMVLVPMILSLSVHEYAHAWAARILGDDTAEGLGRLNLNPLSHIDPVGTVGLPMITLIANGAMGSAAGIPFFGWAKPVPVNPSRLSKTPNKRIGMMLVAAAGPLSNLVLAILSGALISVAAHFGEAVTIPDPIVHLLRYYMLPINIGLFIFNMIPIYPLDGHRVVSGLLSGEKAIRFERFNAQFGTMMLLAVIFFAHSIIAYPFRLVYSGVLSLVGLA